MPSNYGNISVTTSATLIVAANPARRNLTLVNNGVNDVYIGPDSSITTSNAPTLFGGSTRDQDLIPEGYQGDIYGIVASNTGDVRYWEVETP